MNRVHSSDTNHVSLYFLYFGLTRQAENYLYSAVIIHRLCTYFQAVLIELCLQWVKGKSAQDLLT